MKMAARRLIGGSMGASIVRQLMSSRLTNARQVFNCFALRSLSVDNRQASRLCRRTFATEVTADVEATICSDADADELEMKRNKSRLKPWTRRRMLGYVPDASEIMFDYQTTVKYRRRLYAKYGRASGIDPCIMWPSADELRKTVEREKEIEPDLGEMLKEVGRKSREEAEQLRVRELKVDQQMARMDGWMKELQARKAKKIAEVQAIREKKQRLIEEVSQYFGYKLSPKDPKFQEVLEKKEKEERKAAKEAKKTERMSRELAKLAAMAQQTGSDDVVAAADDNNKDTNK